MSNQMNNNRTGNQRMNGNNNNKNKKYKYNLTEITPVFRPRVFDKNNDQISFFIPRVDVRTSFEKVVHIFHYYHIGIVNNVDFVLKQDRNGYDYKAAYVHFHHFHNSQNSCMLVNTIRDDGSDFIYCDKYDKSKKWQVFINTGKKHYGDKPKGRLNLSLLEAQVDNAYAERKPADLYDENEAILNKKKEEYESQMSMFWVLTQGCGHLPGKSPNFLKEAKPELSYLMRKGLVNRCEDLEEAKDELSYLMRKGLVETPKDLEEGEIRDA
jgi:hypothetical protein